MQTLEVFNCSYALKRKCPSGYCCTAVKMISEDVDWGVCSKYKEIGERCLERLLVGCLSISFEVLDFLNEFCIPCAVDGPERDCPVFPIYSF